MLPPLLAAFFGQLLIPTPLRVVVSGGSSAFYEDISWTILCEPASATIGMRPSVEVTGGAPHDDTATFFKGHRCVVTMRDAEGNGWNGAQLTVDGHSFTLDAGEINSAYFTVSGETRASPPPPPFAPPAPALPPLPPRTVDLPGELLVNFNTSSAGYDAACHILDPEHVAYLGGIYESVGWTRSGRPGEDPWAVHSPYYRKLHDDGNVTYLFYDTYCPFSGIDGDGQRTRGGQDGLFDPAWVFSTEPPLTDEPNMLSDATDCRGAASFSGGLRCQWDVTAGIVPAHGAYSNLALRHPFSPPEGGVWSYPCFGDFVNVETFVQYLWPTPLPRDLLTTSSSQCAPQNVVSTHPLSARHPITQFTLQLVDRDERPPSRRSTSPGSGDLVGANTCFDYDGPFRAQMTSTNGFYGARGHLAQLGDSRVVFGALFERGGAASQNFGCPDATATPIFDEADGACQSVPGFVDMNGFTCADYAARPDQCVLASHPWVKSKWYEQNIRRDDWRWLVEGAAPSNGTTASGTYDPTHLLLNLVRRAARRQRAACGAAPPLPPATSWPSRMPWVRDQDRRRLHELLLQGRHQDGHGRAATTAARGRSRRRCATATPTTTASTPASSCGRTPSSATRRLVGTAPRATTTTASATARPS